MKTLQRIRIVSYWKVCDIFLVLSNLIGFFFFTAICAL